MTAPIIIADRMTRDGSRTVGLLELTHDAARVLAGDGVGLFVANCPFEEQVRLIPRLVRNAEPWQVAVAAHSYAAIDELEEEANDLQIPVATIGGNGMIIGDLSKARLLVSIPERLLAISKHVRSGEFTPRIVCLMDPWGISTRVEEWNGYRNRRANCIGQLRSVCLAAGAQVLPVIFAGVSAAAMFNDNIRTALGVEALQYVDCRTLRVAIPRDAITSEVPSGGIEQHWLDDVITHAMSHRSLIVVTGSTFQAREAALRGYARDRNYPIVDLGKELVPLITADVESLRQRESVLRRLIQQINKRVVLLTGSQTLCDEIGVRTAFQMFAADQSESVLAVAAPDNFGKGDFDALRFQVHDVTSPLRKAVAATIPTPTVVVVPHRPLPG